MAGPAPPPSPARSGWTLFVQNLDLKILRCVWMIMALHFLCIFFIISYINEHKWLSHITQQKVSCFSLIFSSLWPHTSLLPLLTELWRIRPCWERSWSPSGWWRSGCPGLRLSSPPRPAARAWAWQNTTCQWRVRGDGWRDCGLTLPPWRMTWWWRTARESPCTSHSRCPAGSHSARRSCPGSQITDLLITGLSIKHPHHFEWPHGEQVCHHGAEARGEAGLGDEAELELSEADDVITLLPVPAGDVE